MLRAVEQRASQLKADALQRGRTQAAYFGRVHGFKSQAARHERWAI